MEPLKKIRINRIQPLRRHQLVPTPILPHQISLEHPDGSDYQGEAGKVGNESGRVAGGLVLSEDLGSGDGACAVGCEDNRGHGGLLGEAGDVAADHSHTVDEGDVVGFVHVVGEETAVFVALGEFVEENGAEERRDLGDWKKQR